MCSGELVTHKRILACHPHKENELFLFSQGCHPFTSCFFVFEFPASATTTYHKRDAFLYCMSEHLQIRTANHLDLQNGYFLGKIGKRGINKNKHSRMGDEKIRYDSARAIL